MPDKASRTGETAPGSTNSESPRTRLSLISRVRRQDNSGWQEFDVIYGRLIYNVARRKGLQDADAKDVVQETYRAVLKGIHRYQHHPDTKSFRRWLRTIVKRKIIDYYRKRPIILRKLHADDKTPRNTPTIERIPDISTPPLEKVWAAEWAKVVMAEATKRVKQKASIEQYQIYDQLVFKDQPVKIVAETFGKSPMTVYLAKHRINALIKKEIENIEKSKLSNPR